MSLPVSDIVAIVGDHHQQLPQISLPGSDIHHFISSDVGTVAAVAALASTLFRPQIDIHNLL